MPLFSPGAQEAQTGIKGVAESGGISILIDSTKDFSSLNVIGKTIALIINGVTYYRDVLDAVGDQIVFGPLPVDGDTVVAGTRYFIYIESPSNSDFIENLETATDGQILASNGDGTAEFITLSGDTVIVNDLTTGGASSAASAETVKTLKTNADALQSQVVEKTSYGVVSGLGVAQQTVADMTVKIATGIIYMVNGTRFTPSAVAVQAVDAADATNPRIDIIYVNSSGVVSYLAGTAGATPSAPSVPAGGQLIAEISVAANATTVVTANIAMRQKKLWVNDWITPTLINGWAYEYTPVRYRIDQTGKVYFMGRLQANATSTIFILPVGYRPQYEMSFGVFSNDDKIKRITVYSDGRVTSVSALSAFITIDNISFYAN